MSKLFLFAVLAILLADASGVVALVSLEPCTSLTETVPDGQCPALCVRCGCCAQPIVAVPTLSFASYQLVTSTPSVYTRLLTTGSPHDILHVPK